MTKMWKLDSFMKESQRMNGTGVGMYSFIYTIPFGLTQFYTFLFSWPLRLVGLNRKVMTDLTLSDGTFLPSGTFLAANLTAMHADPLQLIMHAFRIQISGDLLSRSAACKNVLLVKKATPTISSSV